MSYEPSQDDEELKEKGMSAIVGAASWIVDLDFNAELHVP